ncbi:MAG: N-acetylmannosamine-6-phosphate 2-epimerase [Candidatus Limnocylindrus sp.]
MSARATPRFTAAALQRMLRGGLIVSCQALEGEALHGSAMMARMALAAVQGGAVAIRANSPDDVAAIRAQVSVPVIGLWKRDLPGFDVRITPRLEDALALVRAGADVIACDATERPHPEGRSDELITAIINETAAPILADVATVAEAEAAMSAGASFAATTLSGYVALPTPEEPDIELVREIATAIGSERTIAEGRYRTASQVAAALHAGALAVCVGGAITRPTEITERMIRDVRREGAVLRRES